MGVIRISVGEGGPSAESIRAELREKLGQHQCNACHRIFSQHTDEELDKCYYELFPIMKLTREKQEIEFHIPDKEYSPEEMDVLARQITDQVMKHDKATSKRIGAELKAYLDKRK